MAIQSTHKKRTSPRRRPINKKQDVLSVVSVRISDQEKERICEIMRCNNIKRYADVLRQAIRMVKVPHNTL